MKDKYQYLCEVANEMNEVFKSEGSYDRAIVIQSDIHDKRTLKIVILRYTPMEKTK